MKFRLTTTALLAINAIIVPLMIATPAVATDGPPSEPLVGTMIADCDSASPETLAYMEENDITVCDGAQNLEDAARGIVYGNCGSSSLYIGNNGGGTANITYGFSSSVGTMVRRDLSITWSGDDAAGTFPDSSVMFATVYSSPSRLVIPGFGPAGARLGGSATTFYGLNCTMVGAVSNTTL